MLKGERELDRGWHFDWAIQGKLSASDWNPWRKVIKRSLLSEQGMLLELVGA